LTFSGAAATSRVQGSGAAGTFSSSLLYEPHRPGGPMIELEEEIKEIKKEIIESRNLMIKTDNLVKNLGADIKAIQKKQESYERKYIFNSIAAYVIFVALIGTGAYFLVESRVEKLRSENQELNSKDAALKAKIVELENQLKSRERASRQALQVYEQLQKAAASEDAILEFDQLIGRGLTPLEQGLLGDIVAKKRKDIAQIQFADGKRALARKKLEQAEAAFRKTLKYLGKTKDPLLTDLYYELGVLLHKQKRYRESTDFLERMLQRSTDQQRNGEASYYVAYNNELSALVDKAREGYLKFLQYYPKHKLRRYAQARLRKLQ
jgi:tetratricopeptide (TPR) repeat protein